MEELPILIHSHVIKVTALMTAITCGTYVFWHTFIKHRQNYDGNNRRPQQQPRRQRRLYTNDGSVIPNLAGSRVSVITLRSDEYLRYPVRPTVIRTVQPVLSCVTMEQLIKKKKEKKQTPSRDLKPGRKRPITACVAGRYHRVMPANEKKKPPEGYAPVHSNQGQLLWQRLPPNLRPRPHWMLHHPFIRGWNAARRRDVDGFQFWFVPLTAAAAVEENENDMAANADNNERDQDRQEFDDNDENDEWDFLDRVDLDNILDVFAPTLTQDQADQENTDYGVQADLVDADTLDLLASEEETIPQNNRSAPLLLFVRPEVDEVHDVVSDEDGDPDVEPF